MIPKNDIDRDLRCIHALRFITMYCVIIGHTILFLNVFPVYNPQYIELVSVKCRNIVVVDRVATLAINCGQSRMCDTTTQFN